MASSLSNYLTEAPAPVLAIPTPTYWDYLRLDQLLELQQPRTELPDERPFIVLHQIAELVFSLIIHELEQLTQSREEDVERWRIHLLRIVHYFGFLNAQLKLTAIGVGKAEFSNFRHALFPASGFQSFQFRKIELLSARLYDLMAAEDKDQYSYCSSLPELIDHLYWRRVGAFSNEGRNLTLVNFENRYLDELVELAHRYQHRNVAARYAALPPEIKSDKSVIELLREYDRLANRTWPEMHYRIATEFLSDGPVAQPSTGDTDWRVYLQAKQRHICFFPELTAN